MGSSRTRFDLDVAVGRAPLGLDLSALPRGVYFVRLDVNGKSAGRRFLRVE